VELATFRPTRRFDLGVETPIRMNVSWQLFVSPPQTPTKQSFRARALGWRRDVDKIAGPVNVLQQLSKRKDRELFLIA